MTVTVWFLCSMLAYDPIKGTARVVCVRTDTKARCEMAKEHVPADYFCATLPAPAEERT